jgi:membrane protease YdiL (CAAX protease family)
VPRWVHPQVISRAAPLSLLAVFGLLLFDDLSGVLFHTDAGRAMHSVERATGGWVHHSLAWGAIFDTAFAALAFAAGVRLHHLGIDRRELRRWIATALVSWCAIQLVMIVAAKLGLVAPLVAAEPLPTSVGMMIAVMLHVGLFEEIMARGILLPALARRFGVTAGIALGALVFALGHVPVIIHEGQPLGDALDSLGQYWCWAVVDSVLYLRCGSLLTVAALHAVYDAPTPFAISGELYTILGYALYAGAAVYIWLRRWPSLTTS